MRAIYHDHLINYTWYADVNHHDDGTVTIHRHWRLHRHRDKEHPESKGTFSMIEDDKRIVHEFKVWHDAGSHVSVTHKVRNPKHVFSYNGE